MKFKFKFKVKVMAKPATITMLDLRERAEEVVNAVQKGRRMILTYRGRPVMRLEPILDAAADPDDAFYRLSELAAPGGRSLRSEEIDAVVYGS
jgi:prevent-host-death family protein